MQGEVATLRSSGIVSARTSFPGGRHLEYVVESSPANIRPEASLSESTLTIRLPETSVLAWAGSDQVSIRAEQPLDDGGSLDILVEKDFACLAPRDGEDESDMYPHPQAGGG
jgi:hypothetical protein